jgi:plasmid stabilization system protein ParE
VIYRVLLADSANADVERIYDWVCSRAPAKGAVWFEELIDSLYSLERLANRCPFASEAEKAGREIRCLSFGRRRGVYRILYEVDEKRQTVWILHIRHAALQRLSAESFSQIPGDD